MTVKELIEFLGENCDSDAEVFIANECGNETTLCRSDLFVDNRENQLTFVYGL